MGNKSGLEQLYRLTRSSLNAARALRLIWRYPGISRSETARQLGLDKSTVSDIVSRLLQLGVIAERSSSVSTPQGGRPPVGLAVNPDFGAVAGIDLQPDHYTLALTALDGRTLRSLRIQARVRPETVVQTLTDAVGRAREELTSLSRPLLGTGAGITGIVDSQRGYINHSIPLRIWEPIAVQQPAAEQTGGNIIIDNDANCCAWGEIAFHPDRSLQDFIFVLVELSDPDAHTARSSGIGVGFSFVIGGKVYRGSDFTAGEFRSLFWKRDSQSQFSLKDEETFHVRSDRRVRRSFMRELARHIALFSNTLNLSHVFIGGDIEEFSDELIPILRQEQQKNWVYRELYDIQLSASVSSHGGDAVAIGAAGMMMEELFDVTALSRVCQAPPLENGPGGL